MTMVIEAEPDTILIKDATTDNASFVLGNVYDQLTARDWSNGTSKIVGELAESFSRARPIRRPGASSSARASSSSTVSCSPPTWW